MTYPRVYLFSQPSCPACTIIKEFLSFQNVFFEEFDISTDYEAKRKMKIEYKSSITPTVVVGGTVIIGLDLDKLEMLIEKNQE